MSDGGIPVLDLVPFRAGDAAARDAAAAARRLSLVFFRQPNHDALIEALPSCTDEGNPARHAPVSFGDHWTAKWMATKTG